MGDLLLGMGSLLGLHPAPECPLAKEFWVSLGKSSHSATTNSLTLSNLWLWSSWEDHPWHPAATTVPVAPLCPCALCPCLCAWHPRTHPRAPGGVWRRHPAPGAPRISPAAGTDEARALFFGGGVGGVWECSVLRGVPQTPAPSAPPGTRGRGAAGAWHAHPRCPHPPLCPAPGVPPQCHIPPA